MKTQKLLAPVFALGLAASPAVFAQTWDGSDSTLWNLAANWNTPISVPNASNANANFGVAANQNIDLGGGTFAVGTMNFDGATNYSLSNGTINLSTSVGRSATGTATINAGIQLANVTITSFFNNGNLVFAGNISGAGANSTLSMNNGSGYAEFSGNNTFQGGVAVRSGEFRVGSNTGFGTGGIILGANNSGDFPILSTSGTTAVTLTNTVSLNANNTFLGSMVQNGKLTLATGTINKTVNDANLRLRVRSEVEFTGGIQAGLSDGILRVANNGTATGVLTLGASSNRTGVTEVGNVSNEFGTVRVTASNALGSGNVTLQARRGRLELTGGVSLTNNVSVVASSETETFITSLAGNNTISGSVKINANASAATSLIAVNQDTLTLSGGLTGFTPVSNNYFQKNGLGTLALTGTTDAGIRALTINDGALRVNGTSLTSVQGVEFVGSGSTAPVLETNGTFSRTLGNAVNLVRWRAATSNGGFAANGGVLNVQLNGGTGSLTWASTTSFVGNGGTLVLNSTTANNRVDFQNGLNLNLATRTINVLDNVNSTADVARISGLISGTGASILNKTGAGVLELTGNNTYAGGTTINAGTLLVNNIAGSGAGSGTVTIANTAILGGNGTISGAVTIQSGGTLSAGNSAGILSTGALTLDGSSISLFEINGLTRGTQFDAINVTGALAYGGTLRIDFGFTPLLANTFNLFDFTSQSGTFSAIQFLNPGYGGTFDHSTGVLLVTSIPEPSSVWLVLAAVVGGVAFRRFRMRSAAAV